MPTYDKRHLVDGIQRLHGDIDLHNGQLVVVWFADDRIRTALASEVARWAQHGGALKLLESHKAGDPL